MYAGGRLLLTVVSTGVSSPMESGARSDRGNRMTNKGTNASKTEDRGSSTDRARSFQVMYVDPTADGQAGVRSALEPAYPLTVADSFSSACQQLEASIDCLIVGRDLSNQDGTQFLEFVASLDVDVPLVYFGPKPDADVLASLFEFPDIELVSRTDWEAPASDEVDQLRAHVDELYERSISDVRETVLEIASSLMAAAPDEMDVEIEWALKLIGTRLDADRCVLYQHSDGQSVETHRWENDEMSDAEPVQLPMESFPGTETIQSYNVHAVPSNEPEELDIEIPDGFVGSLPQSLDGANDTDDAAAHPYLTDRNLESLLAVPIVVNWTLEGVITIEQEARRPWPRSLQQQLKTLAELVGYTLERERRRKELETQNEDLERFTSVISHDLRNPLSVLIGYAELIQETGETDHIEDVLVAAERMQTMIEDLLALSRSSNDLQEVVEIDLEELVKDAWSTVDTAEASLEIRAVEPLEGDPNRLSQLFENLFRNAIEHGGSSVDIAVEGTADGFAVEDDGPGIPPDKRDEVFEEGYTGGGGTGLGLSIVSTVVDAHGWSIDLGEGDLGGARFEISTADAVDLS